MDIIELQTHQHSTSITTGNLRVQIRPYHDSEGRAFEEVVVQVLSRACGECMEEIRGGRWGTRVFRVPVPAEEALPV